LSRHVDRFVVLYRSILRLALAHIASAAAGGPLFLPKFRNATMRHHLHIVSAAAAVLAWVATASAAPPEPDTEIAIASNPILATWILIDARDHASGASSAAAVLLGVAHAITARIDTTELRLGSAAVAVTYSLDGGSFRPGTWQTSADGSGLKLSGDSAIEFVTELYDKRELRLAVVRPLSVPFIFTFAVAGTEQSLGTMAKRCGLSATPSISDAGR
jgi:hypothetical protein